MEDFKVEFKFNNFKKMDGPQSIGGHIQAALTTVRLVVNGGYRNLVLFYTQLRNKCTVIHRERCDCEHLKGFFVVDPGVGLQGQPMPDMPFQRDPQVQFSQGNSLPLEIFEFIQTDGSKCTRLVDKKTGKMVAHLVRRELLLKESLRAKFVRTLLLMLGIKPRMDRSGDHLGLGGSYFACGVKVDRRSGELKPYVYDRKMFLKRLERKRGEEHKAKFIHQQLQELMDVEIKMMESLIKEIVANMERIAFQFLTPGNLDGFLHAADVTEQSRIAFARLYSQLVVAVDYMSVAHRDADAMQGCISCLKWLSPMSREIVTHFVFLEYGIAFPLRSGDVLLFDPNVLHCSANPQDSEAFLFSAYTSLKTVGKHVYDTVVKGKPNTVSGEDAFHFMVEGDLVRPLIKKSEHRSQKSGKRKGSCQRKTNKWVKKSRGNSY